MLTYSLSDTGHMPLYEYLYRQIRKDIVQGELRSGEKLPSKRSFAKHLGVSTITIENAYAQLLTEGYLISRPRGGYYVADLGDTEAFMEDPGESDSPAADPVAPAVSWFADFSSNQTDPESFPFSVWAKLSRQVLSDKRNELMQNPPSGGVWELRRAIAAHLRHFRGIAVSPRQILIGAGTEYLYGMLIQFLGFDKVYALEDPGYRKLDRIYESYGVRHMGIPLDQYGLSCKELIRSEAEVLHVTPSHHFPTGITMPAPRRMELLTWAKSSDRRMILEDDYDSEFRMNARPLPSLFSSDRFGKVIYMNTFTKSLSSTIRISYMVLPAPILPAFEQKMGFYSCAVPTFEQYTLAAFLGGGYFEKHINRMRNLSKKKRDLLLDALNGSPIHSLYSISEENAGLHFLLNLKLKEDPGAFLSRLGRSGIRMGRLSDYMGTGNEKSMQLPGDHRAEHTFIMNYSSVAQDKIPEAVRRLSSAVLMR